MRRWEFAIALNVFLGLALAEPEIHAGTVVGRLVPAEQVQALQDELSGLRAKEYAALISQFDRIQASEGWVQAAQFVSEQLAKVGLEATMEAFPSDGERRYYTWTPPMGWRIRRAELWLVEPEKRKLADYDELPTSVAKGSQSADVTAEVVAVRRGTRPEDYQGVDVRGKIVLADGYAGDVHREAVLRRGALGVITTLGRGDRMEFPDFIPYHGLWIRKHEQPRTTFGFTVSARTAEEIRNWLEQGRTVRVHAIVDGEDYPSEVRTLTCTIPGDPGQQEILFIAHLDHYKPGAVDNASGSAALLELARSLKSLIDEGKLPKPKRSIRFVWTSEWYGTVPWIQAHFEEMKRIVAGFNLDMVGGDFVKTRSFFAVIETPWSQPSFVNDLCRAVVEDVARMNVWCVNGSRLPFNYRFEPYSGGSDHWMFNDATVGVPMPMFFQPDFHHHTVQDVPDNIDPTQMERVLLISALCARTIAWAGEPEAIQLTLLTAAGAHQRLEQAASELALRLLVDAKDDAGRAAVLDAGRNRLDRLAEKEVAAVQSPLVLADELGVREAVRAMVEGLREHHHRLRRQFDRRELKRWLGLDATSWPELVPTSELKKTGSWVPQREPQFTCPLAPGYLQETLGPEKTAAVRLPEPVQFEVANFMDGKRTLRQIWDEIRAEFDDVNYGDLLAFVRLLEEAGLVSVRR